MTAPPDDTTADTSAIIAALRTERDAALAREAALAEELAARTAELLERKSKFDERIEYQAATLDVLRAMSASPGDPQPVFQLIVERARAFCDADQCNLALLDGDMLHLQARSGSSASYPAQFPRPVDATSTFGRAIIARDVVQMPDVLVDPEHFRTTLHAGATVRAVVAVPLLRRGAPVGAIAMGRNIPGEFSLTQMELLKTFAEQAVIAIISAETYRTLQTRTADLQESLEYQTATSDVLKVISRSTFDLEPVLTMVAETAVRLCFADQAAIFRLKDDIVHLAVNYGFPPEYGAYWDERGPVALGKPIVTALSRTIHERHSVHIHDVAAVPGYPDEAIRLGKQRTSLGVPLLREGEPIGVILLARQRVEPFTGRQIGLVSTFADQAVIAIENTRLLTEQQEALEQQTATAEVLAVINASPGHLAPVFDALLERAMRLCEAAFGSLYTYDGQRFRSSAQRGVPAAYSALRERTPPSGQSGGPATRILQTKRTVHILDIMSEGAYQSGRWSGHLGIRALVELGGARTILGVPLLKDNTILGYISMYRQEVRAFTDKQIALLENFATQAVIAMENARLLHELSARTDELAQRREELRVTFENMGDGVALFDEAPRLVAWNRKFQDILDVPDDAIGERPTLDEYIRYLTERGEFGRDADPNEQVRRLQATRGQSAVFERTRPNGRIIEVRNNPVAGGGFVLIFSDISERKRNEAEIHAARDAAEEASRTIEAAYRDLKTAQANLIQAEKMASLGQLTAGIAHEIKNPLNFVNNFAELSVDLLGELKDAIAPAEAALNPDQRGEVDEVVTTLTSNLEKITEHGKRADGIVKAMLEHSRGSSAERRKVDINTLADEALNLGYHGARAQDQSFNITLERDFDAGIAPIEVNPQDMTRVFLNIFSNGFYAATRRARNGGDAEFDPTLKVTTRDPGEAVEIRVRDNGTGIPVEIRDKLFQPFFTTKPTGEGTGLGLSITYDIVTKQHGGTITVDSEVGEYSEFVITLPRQMFAIEGDRA